MESGYVTMASAALTALKSSCRWTCWVEGECLLSQDAMNLCNSPQPPLTALCCPSKKQEPKRSSSTTIEVSVEAIATSNHTFVETTMEVHNGPQEAQLSGGSISRVMIFSYHQLSLSLFLVMSCDHVFD